jgi:hypothetical protein
MIDAVERVYDAFPWLRELGPGLYDLVVSLTVDGTPSDLVAAEIRKTETYQDRFSGMNIRRGKNLKAINEAEYLELERSYRNQLRGYDVYDLMFDSTDDFRRWAAQKIGDDWSATELSVRLDEGYASVQDHPETAAAFQSLYGVTPTQNSLLMYFLDENRGISEIENQIAASIIGGEAMSYGLNISRTRAELFASRGVTQEMARSGFADVAREQPLLEKLANIHKFTPLSQSEIEDFFFHEDPEVVKRRQRIFDTAVSEFSGPVVGSTQGGAIESLDIRRTV